MKNNWRIKMCQMVCYILNQECAGEYYEMYFEEPEPQVFWEKVYVFYVLRKGTEILKTETITDLPAHWKKVARETILYIIESKIKFYINNYESYERKGSN